MSDNGNGQIIPLPEAPASATVKLINPVTQFEWMLTTRAHSVKEVVDRMRFIENWAADNGYIAMDSYIDKRKAERESKQQQPTESPPTAKSQPAPVVQPLAQSQPAQGLVFQAKSLAANVNGGKAYWKVKGGKFEKFGVTVWPEVLEATGFFVDELNPMTVYDLTGYTATYCTKEDGKPDKVTVLTKD